MDVLTVIRFIRVINYDWYQSRGLIQICANYYLGICDGYALIVAISNAVFEIIELVIIWRQELNQLLFQLMQKRKNSEPIPGIFSKCLAVPKSLLYALYDYATDWYNIFDSGAGLSGEKFLFYSL